jgi:alpha-beta hydrolase superfamily lysophospholipase
MKSTPGASVDVTPRLALVPAGGRLPDWDGLSGDARMQHRAFPFTRLIDYGMDAADARELIWRTAKGEDWAVTSAEIGERQSALAQRSVAVHVATARSAAAHAAAAFNFAQMAFDLDGAHKAALYQRFEEAIEFYSSLLSNPMERIRLDYLTGQVGGWLMQPEAARATACVIVWGGLSGWGGSFLSTATALIERGIACLVAEGPGQGTPRITHELYASGRTLSGYRRLVDFAVSEAGFARVGIQGNSMGGLIAARVAVADGRVSACVINGAPARPTVPELRSAQEQIFAFTGSDSVTAAQKVLDTLHLEPTEHSIDIPVLILRGGADPLVSFDGQAAFAAAASNSRLLEWPDGEHTLYNHAHERDAVTADWFADVLAASDVR